MATYAIGDIQGCLFEFQRLLESFHFDPAQDRLWLVGDLVNRGPDSLQVLRLVKSLGKSAITVLGNHDLHLLAVAAGVAQLHRSDTLDEILMAPDRDDLLNWLRHQRLMFAEGDFLLVHAGLLPQWNVKQALGLAQEVEHALRSDDYVSFLSMMYGNTPAVWDANLKGFERLRVIVNACTRLRVCTAQGEMEFKFKGELEKMPKDYQPWFDVPQRKSRDAMVIFGHWSALGLKITQNIAALDTGCLWGGSMTAMRLEDRKVFQVACHNSVAKDW